MIIVSKQKGELMIMDWIDGYAAELMRDDIVKGTVTGTATEKSYRVPAMQGWVCPVCGRGLSPYTSVCPCKDFKGWDITCRTVERRDNG